MTVALVGESVSTADNSQAVEQGTPAATPVPAQVTMLKPQVSPLQEQKAA